MLLYTLSSYFRQEEVSQHLSVFSFANGIILIITEVYFRHASSESHYTSISCSIRRALLLFGSSAAATNLMPTRPT